MEIRVRLEMVAGAEADASVHQGYDGSYGSGSGYGKGYASMGECLRAGAGCEQGRTHTTMTDEQARQLRRELTLLQEYVWGGCIEEDTRMNDGQIDRLTTEIGELREEIARLRAEVGKRDDPGVILYKGQPLPIWSS